MGNHKSPYELQGYLEANNLTVKMPVMSRKPNYCFVQQKDGDQILQDILNNLYKAMKLMRERVPNQDEVDLQEDYDL